MTQLLTDAINALTRYANETTGQSDTNLSDAVRTLCDGYGGGGEWTSKGLADGTEPNGVIDLGDCTTVASYAFANRPAITGVIGNSVTSINLYAFQNCQGIQSISFPNIKYIGMGPFDRCGALVSLNLPNLINANTLMCTQCGALEFVDFPKLERLDYSGVFRNCFKLSTLILRHSAVVPINNDVFVNTPFTGYQGRTADLYVPSDLISAYQSASNWSTILSNGYTTIHAIEGSEYE